ncbi:MAG: hypothetical protein GC185_05770 [Alphaproteobacteria bacterium]|nr:hypothetical protein [Alphaproteobacteria bacterium]
MDELASEIKGRLQECRDNIGRPDYMQSPKPNLISRFMNSLGLGSGGSGRISGQYLAENKAQLFDDCWQPAVQFEKQTGMKGIAGQYNLPEGLTPKDLQNYSLLTRLSAGTGMISEAQATGRLDEVVAALSGRNPQLETLKYDRNNAGALNAVVNGVASGFNTSDIQCYLDGASQDASYTQTLGKVQGKLGKSLGWVPSAETLKNVETQMFPTTAPAGPGVKAAVSSGAGLPRKG